MLYYLQNNSASPVSVILRNVVAQDLIFLKKFDFKHIFDSGEILGSSRMTLILK